jgi:hypothetical protein
MIQSVRAGDQAQRHMASAAAIAATVRMIAKPHIGNARSR